MGEKDITVNNLSPIFKSKDSKEEAKQKIETTLYEIFCKYMTWKNIAAKVYYNRWRLFL